MVTKRKRTPKKSLGVNGGGGKVKLTHIQKILMNKGAMKTPLPKNRGR